jgi:cell wall-associated NlpC family hydrolase
VTLHDARLTLARPDLAAAGLEGLVRAGRYAQPWPAHCVVPAAAIRRAPDPDAEQLDQLLFGEAFDVLESSQGWAWGQARRDGYVGYVAEAALAAGQAEPTHWVSAPRAYAFAEPNIKSRIQGLYSMNVLLVAHEREDRFVRCEGAGWFVERQLSPLGQAEPDPATVAEQFVGAAYQWGGRESLGLDCSGLVQQALLACGRACPRDTDMQAAIGAPIAREALRRGDLVFWRGHVGMMQDETRLIHANAYHMAVSIEPLATAIERIGKTESGQPTGFRRI